MGSEDGMFEEQPEDERRDIRLFVFLGIAAGILPVLFLGEMIGLVALYLVGPVAIGAPFVTAISVFTRSAGWRTANNVVLIFLVMGTVAAIVSGVAFYCPGSCSWPLNVPKILVVSVPLVIAGTFWSWLRAD